jgi:hypothetical protein
MGGIVGLNFAKDIPDYGVLRREESRLSQSSGSILRSLRQRLRRA